MIAALGGIAVAYWSRNALVLAFPPSVPGITIDYPGQLDWRVLLLSVAICIGSTMLFALMPAIQSSHVDLSGALKSEGAGVIGGHGRSRLRSALVLVQVSLSFVLLAGTGLLLQSLQRMQNTSPGFFDQQRDRVGRGSVFGGLQTRSRENFSHSVARSRPRASRRRVGGFGAGNAVQL